MKRCTKCGLDLPVTAFSKDRTKRDGLYSSCKNCHRPLYAANAERLREYNRRWYAENRELGIALTRDWMARHPERAYGNANRWKSENKERVREYKRGRSAEDVHRRRARLLGNGGSYTTDEWEALCTVFGDRCLACGSTGPLTVDHVVPLAVGGTNYIDNLQPLCGPCNSAKGTRTIDYRQGYCPCVA